MAKEIYPLLDKINSPADLKKLNEEEIVTLCGELRQFIIDEVSTNPGHFGASLGVVELTVALHQVFNTPTDKIVWDVGHQAYGHKILTGRRDVFNTNRKYKGISGFPKMSESIYDSFGVGHSSTSISAALGMAVAAGYKHDKKHVVAVIGDGSLTGGLAFEGLNNAGTMKSNLLVVLNDNNISIDPNVGALQEYLLDITTSKTYNKFKSDIWKLLGAINKLGPNAQRYAQKIENAVKTAVLKQSNLFEALNFRYFGPIDGHDVVHLTRILRDLKDIPGPKLLHVLTKKGKGFEPAEKDQTIWHAPGLFNKVTGERVKITHSSPDPPKYQDVFGETLAELAHKNDKIVGVTPAMSSGCGMKLMMKEMPTRIFDVGIAEQHAVTFSAGLAAEGMLPFCNIYSSFMQRAYDQVIHDVALQKLQVVFCLDRAGLVGDDGATHHGAYDIAYLRTIPGITIAAPMDEIELRNMMFTAQLKGKGPFAIRYPRGNGVHINWKLPFKEIPVGEGRMLHNGKDLAIISIGHPGNFVEEAISMLTHENIHAAHFDMRFVKPIDENLLHKIGKKFKHVISVEDGSIMGGLGSALLEFFNDHGYTVEVKRLGIPDRFIEHGTQQELYRECGFDALGIFQTAKTMVKPNVLSRVG